MRATIISTLVRLIGVSIFLAMPFIWNLVIASTGLSATQDHELKILIDAAFAVICAVSLTGSLAVLTSRKVLNSY